MVSFNPPIGQENSFADKFDSIFTLGNATIDEDRKAGASRPAGPLSKCYITGKCEKCGFCDQNGQYSYVEVNQNIVRFSPRNPYEPHQIPDFGADIDKDYKLRHLRGWKRGNITRFTNTSRNRLLRRLGQLPCDLFEYCTVLSVTLTYPSEFPTARASKVDLDNFYRSIYESHPRAFSIWKLEPQMRGAPHYHMIMAFSDVLDMWDKEEVRGFIYNLQIEIANIWYRVCGSNDPLHLKFHLGEIGDNRIIERIKSYKQLTAYLSKYVGKPFESQEYWKNSGRYWGVRGEDNIKGLYWKETIRISRSMYYKALRAYKRYVKHKLEESGKHTRDKIKRITKMFNGKYSPDRLADRQITMYKTWTYDYYDKRAPGGSLIRLLLDYYGALEVTHSRTLIS